MLMYPSYSSERIADHCHPTNRFLLNISSLSGTCIPTPLAFLSTLFGILSILSWLFAQAPQCIKNYRLKTAAGLSIYFLVEWLLGDVSNLFGAIFTKQATWQVIVAIYYCTVDIILVWQWLWYEQLRHGRRMRVVWSRVMSARDDHDDPAHESDASATQRDFSPCAPSRDHENKIAIGEAVETSLPGSSQSSKSLPAIRSRPPVETNSLSLQTTIPTPSPRAVLLVSMLICLAQASTTGVSEDRTSRHSGQMIQFFGTILSWLSTLLYLGSRIPQIVKNIQRRSTAGLSPLLFAAAFCGNFFYSASMIANPCAWETFPPYGGKGWVREEGSNQSTWIKNGLPFFLGAAGVLVMDATVGIQFWVYEGKLNEEQEIIVVESTGARKWREIRGWMRGWKPGISHGSAPKPNLESRDPNDRQEEEQSLVSGGGQRETQPDYGSIA